MIVGFWSGMTLDARAATDISGFEIKIKEPVAGDSFPGIGDVEVINPAGAIEVIDISWRTTDNNNNTNTKIVTGTADYNTIYRVAVYLKAKFPYEFNVSGNKNITINNSMCTSSGSDTDDSGSKVIYVYYTFPKTASKPIETLDSIEIKAKDPVEGQKLPDFPVDVTQETTEVTGTSINWYKGTDASDANKASGTAEYNTVYTMRIRYEAKAGYVFGSNTTASVNGKPAECEVLSTDETVCYVIYTFPETGAKQTQTINSVNITIDPPEAGKTLATTCNVSTNISPAGVDVTKVEWVMAGKEVAGPASYNTMYQVKVYLQLQDGYQYGAVQANINSIEARPDPTYSYFYCDFPATDSEPSGEDYKIIEGNNSNYVPGSGKPLRFRGEGKRGNFLRVDVDGNKVEDPDYTVSVSDDSTIIELQPDYLEKLYKGTHRIVIFWNVDGTEKYAEGSFYIGEKGGEIVPGNTGTTQPANDSNDSESKPRHICSFEWVITVDPTTGADGLEEYKCTDCGAVSESHPIPASIAVVKDFYGKVKEAPEKGSITYDTGKLYTISDYILKKMAERNDVSVTVKFEYKNRKYQLTFPAGLDYSAVLTDKETMYGYFGAAAKLGLKVTEQ